MRIGHMLGLSVIPALLSCQPVDDDSAVSMRELHDEKALRQLFNTDSSKVQLIALLSPN